MVGVHGQMPCPKMGAGRGSRSVAAVSAARRTRRQPHVFHELGCYIQHLVVELVVDPGAFTSRPDEAGPPQRPEVLRDPRLLVRQRLLEMAHTDRSIGRNKCGNSSRIGSTNARNTSAVMLRGPWTILAAASLSRCPSTGSARSTGTDFRSIMPRSLAARAHPAGPANTRTLACRHHTSRDESAHSLLSRPRAGCRTRHRTQWQAPEAGLLAVTVAAFSAGSAEFELGLLDSGPFLGGGL